MVNEVLSKNLQVKPLKSDEVAVYKIIGAGEPMPNMQYDDGTPFRKAPRVSLAGQTTINDQFDETNPRKTITNAVTTRPERMPDGTVKQVEVVENVNFNDGGMLYLNRDRMNTYYFIERMNENLDNPFRDRRVRAAFGRVGSSKQSLKELDMKTEVWEAMNVIIMGTSDDIKSLANGLPNTDRVNLDNEIDTIRTDLLRIAETKPRIIIMASNNKEAKKMVQIREAEAFNVLIWDDALRIWYVQKPKGPEELCHIEIGQDRYKALTHWFTEGVGVKAYQFMVMALGKAYKTTV